MASSKKREEERIERAIRALLKLPENRRCINCNSLGPQYVCITFLTFVCTNCSGIHREFTHRVKSVSIARFTVEEVAALESAGNGRARQVYFKEYDPQRHPFPDSSNLQKLREFIRQVYMDRRFSGETQKQQRLKLSEEESHQPRKVSSFNGRSARGAMMYDNNFDPRYRERPTAAGRGSFKTVFEERRSPSTGSRSVGRKSTAFFEIVDNRVRSGSARRRDSPGFSPAGYRQGPDPQRNVHRSCSPVVTTRDNKDAGGSTQNQNQNQNVTLADPAGPADGEKKEQGGNGGNLIDFSMEAEAEHMCAMEKASSIPNLNSLKDLLFGLSVTPTSNVADGSIGSNEHVQQRPLASSISLPLPNRELHQPSASPVLHQPIPSMVPSQSQPQISSLAPNAQQDRSQEAISGSARTELPVDLFANFPEPAPNWQIGPVHGMGYNSPYYPNQQCSPAFPNSARSRNPFDINDEVPESQPPHFPSVDPMGMSYASMINPPSNSFESPIPQGINAASHEGEVAADPFASIMANPKSTGTSGGNPFG